MTDAQPRASRDIRLEGFMNRTPVTEAIEWIDRHAIRCAWEQVSLDRAAGRILAAPFVSGVDMPPAAIAVTNGYALRSADTVGAGSYNPLPFRLQEGHGTLEPFSAALVSSGDRLPAGADAVAQFDVARSEAEAIELIGTVTRNDGVSLQGQEAKAGTPLIDGVSSLRPADLGLLAALGLASVPVVRRPQVRLILAGSKPSQEGERGDANGPMLRALIVRDGGAIETCATGVCEQGELAESIARPGADVVLVCGRTGTGQDDVAPLALQEAGALDIHGIALRPGESTGMGSAGGIPVILLPGSPLHCLCAYDLFAGRLIRQLGGRESRLPYRTRLAQVGRKIVSRIGDVELCWVRLAGGEAFPLGSAGSGGLVSAVRADGFVVVPAALEGYASGTSVAVCMYGETGEMEGMCL
jgi:molybdopterin molybdotransferase